MGGLVWEGSRRLTLLQFQIHPVGREVRQSLRQWEGEYAASAEQGNCSCGASAMLPSNKHTAPCTVWLVS